MTDILIGAQRNSLNELLLISEDQKPVLVISCVDRDAVVSFTGGGPHIGGDRPPLILMWRTSELTDTATKALADGVSDSNKSAFIVGANAYFMIATVQLAIIAGDTLMVTATTEQHGSVGGEFDVRGFENTYDRLPCL